ncbi:hypothetical protein S40288_04310 [Stachybotrys chartarum IBT 40288]|nr:hypothetical protein S40288_04310 [Stachybotrys chartarum IBT 40288]
MAEDLSIKLPDGRTLSYTTFGAKLDSSASQKVVFYFHGFPGTHNEGRPVHEAAAKRGIVVIGITRPGFGDSSPQSKRTFLSFPPDVLYLANHLNVQNFAILGISGGGPYALACLLALPAERLRSVAVVSGMWPISFGTAGMMPHLRVMHNVARWAPSLVGWLVGYGLSGPAQDTEHPERFDELMSMGFKSWPTEDQEVIFNEGNIFAALSQSSREALKHGTKAFADEAGMFANRWDFSLEDIPTDGRLVLWHGAKDANVPIAMADQAAKLISDVEYNRYDNEGHLSLCSKHMDRILESLTRKYGA